MAYRRRREEPCPRVHCPPSCDPVKVFETSCQQCLQALVDQSSDTGEAIPETNNPQSVSSNGKASRK